MEVASRGKLQTHVKPYNRGPRFSIIYQGLCWRATSFRRPSSNVTNMFVILRKSDNNLVSNFFLHKPEYVPPVQTTSPFRIKLCHSDQVDMQCNCRTLVKVYHNSCKTYAENEDDVQYTQCNSSS